MMKLVLVLAGCVGLVVGQFGMGGSGSGSCDLRTLGQMAARKEVPTAHPTDGG